MCVCVCVCVGGWVGGWVCVCVWVGVRGVCMCVPVLTKGRVESLLSSC